MTNKSLAALFFGCILTASAASAQSLLPKPQSFVAGKGAFSTDACFRHFLGDKKLIA